MSLFESLSREERSAILLSRYAGHPPDEGTELSEALCWFAFDLGLDESYTPPTDTSVDPLLRLEYYIRNILYLFRGWFGHPYNKSETLATNLGYLETKLRISIPGGRKVKERVEAITLFHFFIDFNGPSRNRSPGLSAQRIAAANGITWTSNETESMAELKNLRTRVRELFTVICDFPPPMNWTVFYISRRIEDCLREGGHSFGFRKGPSLWVDVEVLESHWGGGTGPNEV